MRYPVDLDNGDVVWLPIGYVVEEDAGGEEEGGGARGAAQDGGSTPHGLAESRRPDGEGKVAVEEEGRRGRDGVEEDGGDANADRSRALTGTDGQAR